MQFQLDENTSWIDCTFVYHAVNNISFVYYTRSLFSVFIMYYVTRNIAVRLLTTTEEEQEY